MASEPLEPTEVLQVPPLKLQSFAHRVDLAGAKLGDTPVMRFIGVVPGNGAVELLIPMEAIPELAQAMLRVHDETIHGGLVVARAGVHKPNPNGNPGG